VRAAKNGIESALPACVVTCHAGVAKRARSRTSPTSESIAGRRIGIGARAARGALRAASALLLALVATTLATGCSTSSRPSWTSLGLGRQAPPPGPAKPADLVDITTVDPSIVVDIRYATTNNFTGVAVYPVGRCLLRREIAEHLARVQTSLQQRKLGLKVWDCYRPISVQQKFWELKPDPRYVLQPVIQDGKPVEGSKHNRGAAVDVTLVDASGQELPMPTDYDDFSQRAHRTVLRGDTQAVRNMRILEVAMVREGFEPLPTEWWHFDGPGWEKYELSDAPLD